MTNPKEFSLYGPGVIYNREQKSNLQFRDTQSWITGASFSLKFLSGYVEWMEGRNDPHIGGSNYPQSLAEGGINARKARFA